MISNEEVSEGPLPPLVVVNMLMGALKRHAAVALGAQVGPDGELLDAIHNITPDEVYRLMVMLATQGLKDVVREGILGIDQLQAFAADVATEMERTRGVGKQ